MPPTILRDGPFGEGMLQAFIEPDPDRRRHRLDQRRRPAPAAHGGVRRRRQQHRPQGRPHPAGRRRAATCTASTTACASRSRPSCGPCCGRGAGEPLLPDELAGLERIRDGARGGARVGPAGAAQQGRGPGDGASRGRRCSRARCSRSPPRPGRPSPGRRSDGVGRIVGRASPDMKRPGGRASAGSSDDPTVRPTWRP